MKSMLIAIAMCATLMTAASAAAPDDSGELVSISMPTEMVAAEQSIKRIRQAKNIRARDKAAMNRRYRQLDLEFKKIWTPLEVNYTERVQLPSVHLKRLREIEQQLQQGDDAGLQLQRAEMVADYADQMKALNEIIKRQSTDLQAWSRGKDVKAFLLDADRLFSKTPKGK